MADRDDVPGPSILKPGERWEALLYLGLWVLLTWLMNPLPLWRHLVGIVVVILIIGACVRVVDKRHEQARKAAWDGRRD